jgi:hypothetical protein
MKPYEVLIFDRNFNLKANSLVDFYDFKYSEDIISGQKNTVQMPIKEDLDITAAKGWYIRIQGNGEQYNGVITSFTRGELRHEVTFEDMIKLFDINVLVPTVEISETYIETYMRKMIKQEFVDTSDQTQKINGLGTITATTSTSGALPYTSNTSEYTKVNILNDLIYPAFDAYSIVTSVDVNWETKQMSVKVGKVSASSKTIEADLSNVKKAAFTFKRSKETNKCDIYDLGQTRPAKASFYLHEDGTWNQNGTSDRISPVINVVETLDGWSIAKGVIDNQIANEVDELAELADIRQDLTSAQRSRLSTLTAKYMPAYAAAHPLSAPNVPGSDTGTVRIGSTSYDKSGTDYEDYTSGAYWDDDPDSLTSRLMEDYSSFHGHIILTARVDAQRTRTSLNDGAQRVINSDYFYLEKPVIGSDVEQCVRLYKNTSAYTTDIQNIYAQALLDAENQRAAMVFGSAEFKNLIELEVMRTDTMIKPLDIKIGQNVDIIHNGAAYSTLLTGRKITAGAVILMFGKVRLELTKILKGAER